jgi:hypothetical protein
MWAKLRSRARLQHGRRKHVPRLCGNRLHGCSPLRLSLHCTRALPRIRACARARWDPSFSRDAGAPPRSGGRDAVPRNFRGLRPCGWPARRLRPGACGRARASQRARSSRCPHGRRSRRDRERPRLLSAGACRRRGSAPESVSPLRGKREKIASRPPRRERSFARAHSARRPLEHSSGRTPPLPRGEAGTLCRAWARGLPEGLTTCTQRGATLSATSLPVRERGSRAPPEPPPAHAPGGRAL